LGFAVGVSLAALPVWAQDLEESDTVADIFTTTDHIFDLRVRTSLRIRELGLLW